jgi:glutathione synthase/RimK-type ligase-like ATP-grasp enzyme
VHVFNQKVIDFVQKKKRVGHENRNNQIRNHQNGWVYCRENVIKPEGIEQLALDAMKALSLNVGAVDIIYNEKENKCYVLEINSAPGLEGTTVEKYINSFLENYSKEFANAIN